MDKESLQQAVTAHDGLQKFMFDALAVRGSVVDLSDSWQQIRGEHHYPALVQNLLGELLAAACLLASNLKFDGSLILQLHGDGPLQLLVAECNAQSKVRATAKIAPDATIAEDTPLRELVNRSGQGRFMLTLIGKNQREPYKGIVPLDGETIPQMLQNYMLRSEQVDTELYLAADASHARGLLLQKMPASGGVHSAEEASRIADAQAQGWLELQALGNTLRGAEMLGTDLATLLHRLFWQQDMRLYEAQAVDFFCPCSREKVGDMLKMLGRDEVEAALADVGNLEIACEFCGRQYRFDPIDCAQLFLGEGVGQQGETRH